MRATLKTGLIASALAVILVGTSSMRGVSAQNARTSPDPATFPYRDLTRELANKMAGTYVVAATGDLLMQEPIGKQISPAIRQILQEADTTVGNMEATIIDRRNWAGGLSYGGNWTPKETAADVADLGYDMLTGANNHTFDMGEVGSRSNAKWLDSVGIPLAGVGPNLTIARQPVFQYLEKGRVAMVAAYPVTGNPTSVASNTDGPLGREQWGVNPLRLTVWNVVTPPQLQQLRAIRDGILATRDALRVPKTPPAVAEGPDRISILGTNYMAGPKPGEYQYEMNPADREAQVLAIRNAKEYADFAIFTMHVHQNRYAFQHYSQDHYPNKYLVDLTHQLVDNGMDMYVGHGNHTMQGVEIYKGRPIFYNLGNFVVHEILPGDATGGMTAVENDELSTDWLQYPPNLKAMVAQTRYQDGKLVEIRLYPVDLGVGKNRPWSKMSIARTPTPALATEILADVQRYSEPFGTKIEVESGVGIIRVRPDATVPVGVGIRESIRSGGPGGRGAAGGRGGRGGE